jgi:hypothetical protein
MKRDRKPFGGKAKQTAADAFGANSEIARRLRDYYSDVVAEDVPRRFVDLLSELERADEDRKRGLTDDGGDGRK